MFPPPPTVSTLNDVYHLDRHAIFLGWGRGNLSLAMAFLSGVTKILAHSEESCMCI